jgi:hypothetical protein
MADWYDANGAGDKDTGSEAFFGRAQAQLNDQVTAGVSCMLAHRKRTIDGTTTSFGAENAFGMHVRWNAPGGFAVQSEYCTGEILDAGVEGWYGLLEYRLPRLPTTLFYRYDTCDRSLPHEYERHTAGLAWDVNSRSRATLQAETIDDYEGNGFTNFGVQYQLKY